MNLMRCLLGNAVIPECANIKSTSFVLTGSSLHALVHFLSTTLSYTDVISDQCIFESFWILVVLHYAQSQPSYAYNLSISHF